MKPTLITGATGFVGWHVARNLIEHGHHLRFLVRSESRLREIEGEVVTGDLRDPESLERAVNGCGQVFHVAADYRLFAKTPRELYRTNVDGTRNILEAARRAGVERFVHTSTVGCIGIPRNAPGDENTPVTLHDMKGAYKRSKFLAERLALDFAHSGFPVVIVNPTAPIGDHDIKPTPTGRIVVDFVKGGMPAFIDTGLNLVDVRDTAEGHRLACEYGRAGERYILGCENLTLAQIFQKLAGICGTKAPVVRLPYAVAWTAGLVSTGLARMTGREPRVAFDAVRMARKKMFVRHDKAVRELGFAPQGVDAALARALEWFRQNGYC
ncbi:MAG: hopanoid-associated sugar epimerase [Bryobacteraceae bacterium]